MNRLKPVDSREIITRTALKFSETLRPVVYICPSDPHYFRHIHEKYKDELFNVCYSMMDEDEIPDEYKTPLLDLIRCRRVLVYTMENYNAYIWSQWQWFPWHRYKLDVCQPCYIMKLTYENRRLKPIYEFTDVKKYKHTNQRRRHRAQWLIWRWIR